MTLQLIPFIMLDGKANEAIQFYETSLGANVLFKQTFGEGPETPATPLPAAWKDRVAHSVLNVCGADLFVSDTLPGLIDQSGSKVNICLTTSEVEQAKQFYESLQQGGHVNQPLREVHFSPAYGVVTDKFGVTFQIFAKCEV